MRDIEGEYVGRCLVGFKHLKTWIEDTLGMLGVVIKLDQVLPNGYYIFLFKENKMDLKVTRAGQRPLH